MSVEVIVLALSLLVFFGAISARMYWSAKSKARSNEQIIDPTPHKYDLPTSPLTASASFKESLGATEKNLFGRLRDIFRSSTDLALENHWDEIEEVLMTADLGPKTVQDLLDFLRKTPGLKKMADLQNALGSELRRRLAPTSSDVPYHKTLPISDGPPKIIMIVGVNGAGKTTSIGKLASLFRENGQKVLVIGADTFRAAAVHQLQEWVERAGATFFGSDTIKDPAAVVFQGLAQAKSFGVVIVDTAGRLHTQSGLMEELKKVKRIADKAVPGAPHEIWIVLDANSGLNALQQAREFHKALNITGAIVTKLDGTAKGGVILGLANELQLPVKYVGVGEKVDQLRAFNAEEFCDALNISATEAAL